MDRQVIKDMLKEIKLQSFTHPETATDEEAMGLLISHFFEWNGKKIMEASANALEDANFHPECAVINEMINKLK